MNYQEMFHQIFKGAEGQPMKAEHTIEVAVKGTGIFEPSSIEGILKVIKPEDTVKATLTLDPSTPKEAVVVAYSGSDDYGFDLVRYPDNTYHIVDLHPDYYNSSDKYFKITSVDSYEPQVTSDMLKDILTDESIFWYYGGTYPKKYEEELYQMLEQGKFNNLTETLSKA